MTIGFIGIDPRHPQSVESHNQDVKERMRGGKLAPPRQAVGGLYVMVFKNTSINVQMIHLSSTQGIGLAGVATILEKSCGLANFMEVQSGRL